MTRAWLKELLREMVLKQAPNCTFGGEINQITLVSTASFPNAGLVQVEDSTRQDLIHYSRRLAIL